MDKNNGWQFNGTWESNSPYEESSDERFEIFVFEPDRDEKLSENNCLQSHCIDLASCGDVASLSATLIQ